MELSLTLYCCLVPPDGGWNTNMALVLNILALEVFVWTQISLSFKYEVQLGI